MGRLIIGGPDGFTTNMTVTGSDLHIVNEDGNRTVVGGTALTFKSGSSSEIKADFSDSQFRIVSGSRIISEVNMPGDTAFQVLSGSAGAKLSISTDDGYTIQLTAIGAPRISFLGSAGAGGVWSAGVNGDGDFTIDNQYIALGTTAAEFRINSSGHITASGNISSSGYISASSFSGDFSGDGGGLVNLTGTASAGGWIDDGDTVRLQTAANQVAIGTATAATNMELTVAGDISASGVTYSSQSVIHGGDGKVLPAPDMELTVAGDISASGHIFLRALHMIHLNSPGSGDDRIYYADGYGIVLDSAEGIFLASGKKIYVGGAITASGNISSSGTIYGNDLQIQRGATFNVNQEAAYDFKVRSENKTNTLYVDSNKDKVGIGFNSPDGSDLSSSLHIAGDLTTDSHITASGNISASGNVIAGEWFSHGSDPDTGLYMEDDLVNLKAGDQSVIKLDWGNSDDKILINNTNANIDLHVMADDGEVVLSTDATNNRVGVNTTTPPKALTVEGDISASGDLYVDDINSSGFYVTSSGQSVIQVGNTGDYLSKWEWHRDGTRKWVIYNDGRTSPSIYQDALVFKHGVSGDSDSTHINMALSPNDQSAKFYGNITASGNISASGAVYGSTFYDLGVEFGADYVFEPEYVLRTLTEVEEHIEEHQHLPGMPSIDDTDGWKQLSIGDRDMKLLEKVEELTLYIIDLQKQINELKKVIK